MLNQQKMKQSSDKISESERSKQNGSYSNRVKYKCQHFSFSAIIVGAIILMPMFGCTQLNIEGRLELDGFKNITEQTATIARLMNAIFLQNYFQLKLVTMEDVINEVLDVPRSSLFYKMNERDIRDTVSDMKSFALLTTTPIDERVRIFDEFLLNDTLTKISTIPDLSAYANLQINYSVAFDSSWQASMDMGFLVSATLVHANRSNIDYLKGLFQTSVNSTVIMVEHLKNFYEIYENKLDTFKFVRSQFEEVKSIVPILKAFQQTANHTFLKSLIEKLNSLKPYIPILESWVNSSYRQRIIRQASVMHELLRKSNTAFDQKFLIGLPNGWKDLATLSKDFKKEWLKKLLHDGKSLNELETQLKPMRRFEKLLSPIEKNWQKAARSEYLNCIHKFLKSLQGLDALKSTNISQTLPNAIAALGNLSYNTKYVSDFVDEFDRVVNSCYMNFTSLDSELTNFYLKRNSHFFNDIKNISSAYPVNETTEKQLEFLDNLPYEDYVNSLNFTTFLLYFFNRTDKVLADCSPNIINLWNNFNTFRSSFEFAFNPDVKDVTNVLRVIRTIVPFTEKELSNIVGITDFLLAAKAKLSEWKKLDADMQQEMKKVDVNRMLTVSNAREIASQFAHYHRTLVFYQKPELLQFFHNFRSNGLKLARKIADLPPEEKKAAGEVWHRMLEENETQNELTIINFLRSVVAAERILSKNYSRPEGSLTSLAKVLFNLNEISTPALNILMMRESIEALKITSLGQSEEVSNAERSLAQLESVYSLLAHKKYQIGTMLNVADEGFKSFFTKPPEDWTLVLLATAIVAYFLIFIAVVILCCVYKWKFKIADVKPQK